MPEIRTLEPKLHGPQGRFGSPHEYMQNLALKLWRCGEGSKKGTKSMARLMCKYESLVLKPR